MSARLTAVAFAACFVSASPPASACENFVEYNINDAVRLIVRAEKQFDAGQYGRAKRTLAQVRFPMPVLPDEPTANTIRLQMRRRTLQLLIGLRMHASDQDHDNVVAYFKARTDDKETAKDVRYRAWLAEAYVAAGKPDEARSILVDLHTHDLIPDAYGYRALAILSTSTERYDYYKACRTRAKNKAICELPAEVKSTVHARR